MPHTPKALGEEGPEKMFLIGLVSFCFGGTNKLIPVSIVEKLIPSSYNLTTFRKKGQSVLSLVLQSAVP